MGGRRPIRRQVSGTRIACCASREARLPTELLYPAIEGNASEGAVQKVKMNETYEAVNRQYSAELGGEPQPRRSISHTHQPPPSVERPRSDTEAAKESLRTELVAVANSKHNGTLLTAKFPCRQSSAQ